MDSDRFCKQLLALAKDEGFEKAEAYLTWGDSLMVSVSGGQVEDVQTHATLTLRFRGLLGGRAGRSSTEVLDEEALRFLVRAAKENAEVIENDDPQFLYAPKKGEVYAEVDGFRSENDAVTVRQRIELAERVEQACLREDGRVRRVEYNRVYTGTDGVRIVNTEGLDVSFTANPAYAYAVPILEAEGGMIDGSAFQIEGAFRDLDPERIAREAVQEAVGKIGARSIPSGGYPAVLKNSVMAALLETFDGVFSADEAQKGLSLLAGKEGQTVAAACVSLTDDPLLPGGYASQPFDGEGVPTRTKAVIQGGVLKTLLYNLRTAHKAGKATTGNGHRTGAVAPSNLYIEKGGAGDWRSMAESMGDGVVVTDMMGMHAGANTISGDFSLAARGFLIRDGQIAQPVEQITVAGNFFSLLREIEAVGDDLFFGMPGASCDGSPSVRLRSLAVAGNA